MLTGSTEMLFLTFLTVAGGTIALAVVLIAYLAQAGRRRAALAPAAAALSLVGAVCGIGAASKHLAQTFADMASSGGGGMAAIVAGCSQAQNLMRVGDAAALVTLVLAAGLGWLNAESPRRSDRPQASAVRLRVLLALLILPVLLVGLLHEYSRATNRMAVAVAEEPAARPGEPGEGAAGIEPVVSRMTRGIYLGFLGAPVLLVVLAGFAAGAGSLAWRVEVPASFRVTGTALLLLSAALTAAGILLFERPVQIPR